MTESGITYDNLAASLLNDMINNIIKNEVLLNLSNHLSIEKQIGDNKENNNFKFQETDSSKDIYGQDKMKLKTVESGRYFSCENCGRKIAGGRFAQHINKCLERKRK
ncbi:unnamed protein product [Candida verbasci]|uniref:SAGA-associated factor 11 n=1 Tax=Candida verbasci TaxID=1227364 RepID=A0A9W4TVF4_9ASCO|nr:unnamed protein product [Candida verbasci]